MGSKYGPPLGAVLLCHRRCRLRCIACVFSGFSYKSNDPNCVYIQKRQLCLISNSHEIFFFFLAFRIFKLSFGNNIDAQKV